LIPEGTIINLLQSVAYTLEKVFPGEGIEFLIDASTQTENADGQTWHVNFTGDTSVSKIHDRKFKRTFPIDIVFTQQGPNYDVMGRQDRFREVAEKLDEKFDKIFVVDDNNDAVATYKVFDRRWNIQPAALHYLCRIDWYVYTLPDPSVTHWDMDAHTQDTEGFPESGPKV
jgi:hypothetical protein